LTRSRLDLSGQWRRSIDDVDIGPVTVPGGYAPVGECVLTHEFQIRSQEMKRPGRWFLCTEGVLASAEFTLNSHGLGRAGPFTPYDFEIPSGVLGESNRICARVRDLVELFGPTPGRRFDAGLVRDIYLQRRPAAFIESVAFRPALSDDLSVARCTVTAAVNGPEPGLVEAILAERETGRVVAAGQAEAGDAIAFEVERPELWSCEAPHLYTLTVRLAGKEGDYVEEMVGFRRLEIRGRDFFLNGRRLVLKGVCRHEFTHASGYSPPVAEVRRELAHIKQAGFNYIRLVHSPQSAYVPRIASELGILVSEEPGACWHDLGNPAIAAAAHEALRRTVLRDRNCPSVLAYLIYNECLPNTTYAKQAAAICRELDPDCFLSFADDSREHDNVKAMAGAAGLAYYGINRYDFHAASYVEAMKHYQDRPLVFTEWGGWYGQGNPRLLGLLASTFAQHVQSEAEPRVAGCSFWVWADYEEHSRPGPGNVDGWTVEGLVDRNGQPRSDLQALSEMCFAMDHPVPAPRPRVEVLAEAPGRESAWTPVALTGLAGDQSALVGQIEEMRRQYHFAPPVLGRVTVAGIEFACSEYMDVACPLLLGPGREQVEIPVNASVRAVAVLGHIALRGGYPFSEVLARWHSHEEPAVGFGELASRYEFVFDHGTVVHELRHGINMLRGNDICRWWKTAPRAPQTAPAIRIVLDPSYEELRFDLWETEFETPGLLKFIRWSLMDGRSIQAMLALSVAGAK
jgi:hypothetical protein